MTVPTDEHRIPFGKYRGRKLKDVPANYLHWLWLNSNDRTLNILEYIENSMDVLKKECPDLIWEK
jgi:hypothetical protein